MKFADVSAMGWSEISRLSIAVVVAVLVGLIFGHVGWALAIVLGCYAIAQTRNLLRLEQWLRRRRVLAPPDMDGSWGEVVAIVNRIYRRKQFHKSRVIGLLREFRRLTTALPEGAILLGPDHEILWFNRRAADWLALRRRRDRGIRVENLVRHPAFISYLRDGVPADGVVVHDSGENGRWLSFNVVRTGDAERSLLILRDVSHEMQVESMRKDFVANASHELRSPLTVVTGYLDALADDGGLDPAWSAPISEMRRQSERMSTIINDLLELSKLESGERRQAEQPVDIGGMLAMLRREVASQERRPQTLTLTLDSDAWLLAAESEMHSIISNLVSNAVKYTPTEGEVEMRWWTDQSGAHVSVRDTGVGISQDNIPRLTERFYRVDSGRSREMGGSGLGLAIVKHALQRYEGTLSVVSVEGVGSTFTCHFPAHRVVPRPNDYIHRDEPQPLVDDRRVAGR